MKTKFEFQFFSNKHLVEINYKEQKNMISYKLLKKNVNSKLQKNISMFAYKNINIK